MRDLRSITEALPAKLGITTPPVDDVAARAQLLRLRRRGLAASALLLVTALVAVPLRSGGEEPAEHLRVAGDGVSTTVTVPDLPIIGSSTTSTPTSSTSTSSTSTTRPGNGSNPGGGDQPGGSNPAVCRAEANKASDTGVTENRIEVVTTRNTAGAGSAYLGTAHLGVQAVVNRVNAAGGVCGRRLELRFSDDPASQTGSFAVVGPTMNSKLDQALANGQVDNAGLPVVGGVGLVKPQYSSRWAWPVGPSMAGATRSTAQHAWEQGARTFGVVYDSQQLFGLEGAQALQQYIGELSGATLRASVGIAPGKPSYANEAKTFNDLCGSDECDFVAMLLSPETANTYINSQVERQDGKKRGFGRMLTGGAPLLFNERFARDCGKYCDGMLLWTGYIPPIGEHASDPDVARYVDSVKTVDPGIDVNNQFLEGAYIGTELFVQALREVGSNLTRARLQQALDSLTFRSGLVTDLRWGTIVPSQRVANTSARAFSVKTASGSFVGFQDAGTGWRRDPHPGSFPS